MTTAARAAELMPAAAGQNPTEIDMQDDGPAPASADNNSLSPARLRFVRAIAAVKAIADEHTAIVAPAHRLRPLLTHAEACEAEVMRLREAADLVLADWLASGQDGPRPTSDPDLAAAEARLAEAQRNARAAEIAIARATAKAAEIEGRLTAAGNDQWLAAAAIIVEEGARLAAIMRTRCEAVLAVEATITAVADHLDERSRGAGNTPAVQRGACHRAAATIRAAAAEARRSAQAPAVSDAARFIERLFNDPNTTIEV
jgi:hypothetical protein